MAITKMANKSTKGHTALKNCLAYVLKKEKIEDNFVGITGPFLEDEINVENVYKSFIDEKVLWGKDEKRMYYHSIISFHPEEKITPQEALEFGLEFANKWFDGFQTLVTVHEDRDHTHIHFISNSVSFLDGKKYKMSKKDLQRMKDLTNEMCLERGLSIAKKGKHFDGTDITNGEIISWNKNEYYMLQNKSSDSVLLECYVAIIVALKNSFDKESFISNMRELEWTVNWKDSRKNIVFINKNGKKIRDSKLTKTLNVKISKGEILNELERNNRKRQEYSRNEDQMGEEIGEEYSSELYKYRSELDEYQREFKFYYEKCEECIREGRIDNRTAEENNESAEGRIKNFEAGKRDKMSRTRRIKKEAKKSNVRDSEIDR